MAYSIAIHRRASDQLAKLDRESDERIRSKLREMVESEWRTLTDYDVRPVAGTTFDVYRTRIGDHWVFFAVEGSLIGILHVDSREGAYGNPDALDQRAGEFY